MSQRDDELCVLEAAARAPARLALVTRELRWTFADAAERVANLLATRAHTAGAPPAPRLAAALTAERSVATVLEIWAALQARVPVALLHPQQPARARSAAEAALAEHQVPADAAVVLFTSGTTGLPRGVVHRRSGLLAAARAHARRLPWRDDDLTLVTLPLAAAGGLAALVRCLAARQPLLLLEEARPWPLAEALAESGATQTSLVPAQLDRLLEDDRWVPPPSLRAVLLGGAACPAPLLRRALERGVPALPTYGMTETLGQVATALPANADAAANAARETTAVGPPLPGVVLRAGTAAAPAAIEIESPSCMIGYLGEAPLAEQRIVTRDLGWIDPAGVLHVLGRVDDVIVTGGHKVAPRLVEDELRATAGVVDACVYGVPDLRWGQLVACALVLNERFDLVAALAAWRDRLPAHQRPRRLLQVAELPRNAGGKVDLGALRQRATDELAYPPT